VSHTQEATFFALSQILFTLSKAHCAKLITHSTDFFNQSNIHITKSTVFCAMFHKKSIHHCQAFFKNSTACGKI